MDNNKATYILQNFEFSFTDADVCNLDDWIPAGESNPHNVRPWLIHDAGFTQAVVFADCEQDAFDIAADDGKLEGFEIAEDELSEGGEYFEDDDYNRLSFLGNHGVPHDIEPLGLVELPNPKSSFVAQFNKEGK
ncbi:MAG: hypothetical protein GY896_22710 [Gammaproteobacteria bacterium]|nr:hypothetical protein [Gammaproteobacteria bacterium]